MTTPVWKLQLQSRFEPVQIVSRTWYDGRQESCLVTAPEYLKWLSEGNTPEPAETQGAKA